MSEVRFVLRDAHRTISSTWHGSCAMAAVAALSADPETIEELEVAIERYWNPRGDGGCFRHFYGSQNDAPYDAGLVVIDLAARLVASKSTYAHYGPKGTVSYHNGDCGTSTRVDYQLADDWLVTWETDHWRSLAEERRQARAAHPPLDARALLFGKPLVEFVAAECFAAFARRDEFAEATRQKWIADKQERAIRWPEEAAKDPLNHKDPETLTLAELAPSSWSGQERYASPYYDALKSIHVAWLMTPRTDLRGETPREIMLAQHDHISWELEFRSRQWSQLGFCPRGLDTTSHAFQFGGFGTHELVKYYDLVRELLWSCWERLTALSQSSNASHQPSALTSDLFMPGDFLTVEVPRLEQVRDEWFETPDPECQGRTPRSVIDRERQRLPEGMSRAEAMHDPDCPCCQMLADMPGVSFWGLDGSSMDDEFAFSMHLRTRKEWDDDQRQSEEFRRKYAAQEAERRRLGVNNPAGSQHPAGSVWSSSFSVIDSPDVPLGIRLFGIGGHLAELITDLREPLVAVDRQPQIDQLNRDFGNLREVLIGADSVMSESLVEPVLARFSQTLEEVAVERPDLDPKCEALATLLKNFLAPSAPDLPKFSPDDDVPF